MRPPEPSLLSMLYKHAGLQDPDERERLKASQCARRRDYSLEAFRESFHRCMDAYENWLNVNS